MTDIQFTVFDPMIGEELFVACRIKPSPKVLIQNAINSLPEIFRVIEGDNDN